MEKYLIQETIGEGAFGVVMKGRNLETNQTVAIKKIRVRKTAEDGLPNNTVREIKSLQHLSPHPHIINLYETLPHGSSVVLVMEYMDSDLFELLHTADHPLPESHVKCLLQMILKGLLHCHRNGIVHRDIKPANLLMTSKGVLKLADFGLSRVMALQDVEAGRLFSHQVATRWYRAPELLFGARKYDFGVDIWAVGCVFGEMLNMSPVFPGENDIDQLYKVLRVLGSPTEETWPGLTELPDYNKITFPQLTPIPFRHVLPNASDEALDFLSRFLVYDPKKRISVEEALIHPYFFTHPLPCHPSKIYIPIKKKGRTEFSAKDIKLLDKPLELPLTPPDE